jgi:hypothetical protein
MLVAGEFMSGDNWTERVWQKKWADRGSAESARKFNAQTAARMIEQGRFIAHDEAVKDAQSQTGPLSGC